MPPSNIKLHRLGKYSKILFFQFLFWSIFSVWRMWLSGCWLSTQKTLFSHEMPWHWRQVHGQDLFAIGNDKVLYEPNIRQRWAMQFAQRGIPGFVLVPWLDGSTSHAYKPTEEKQLNTGPFLFICLYSCLKLPQWPYIYQDVSPDWCPPSSEGHLKPTQKEKHLNIFEIWENL